MRCVVQCCHVPTTINLYIVSCIFLEEEFSLESFGIYGTWTHLFDILDGWMKGLTPMLNADRCSGGGVWALSIESLVFPSPTGYMTFSWLAKLDGVGNMSCEVLELYDMNACQ
jgi:hypothetical protein